MSRIQNSPARRTASPQTNPMPKHARPSRGNKEPRPARLEDSFAAEQRRINQGVANESLTTAEAQQLQAKLDALHERFERDAFEPGGAKSKLPGYGTELRQLQADTKAAAQNDEVDVAKLSSRIDERIAAGRADGTLTDGEGTALKQKADALKLELAAAQTPDQQKAVATKLRLLSREVGLERQDREFDASKRQANLQSRVVAGLTDGSLTAKEAASLLKKVSSLDPKKAAGYARLGRDVFHQRHDRQVNAAVMGTSLRTELASLEGAGKISAAEASALRKTLDAALTPGAVASGSRLNALRERLAAYA